jgi:hypothetical protein
MERHVPMMTLVEGLESQEVVNRARGGGGAFALPRHCGGVVRQFMCGVRADVEGMGEDVGVGDRGGELQFAVGDVAGGFGAGDEPRVDVVVPSATPQHRERSAIREEDEVHAALTCARGITGAAGGGVGVGDQFVNLGGPSAHVFDQPTEVVEKGVRVLG